MNDSSNETTPRLIIVIDIKTNDMQENDIESLIQLPLKKKKNKKNEFLVK
ncbi:hypothetical protein [Lentibacillus cibarius]|nr:hypothetical protein [Lentibacillus cibarius]